MRRGIHWTSWMMVALAVALAASCRKAGTDTGMGPDPDPGPGSGNRTPTVVVNTLLNDRGIIWGMDFLPDGRLIFTQKTGFIGIYDTTTRAVQALSGGPANVSAAGQGGLLDIAVHPDYAAQGWIYLAYSSTGGFLNLARFRISGTAMQQWQVLHTTATASTWSGHYGTRIVFGSDGKLYWCTGEGGSGSFGGPTASNRNSQSLTSLWGKVLRLNDDGSFPADNPSWPGTTGPQPFFSIGHRNPQGMAFEPGSSRLWLTEHGPSGGCELNRIERGGNYGWPDFSAGINYNGAAISGGQHGAGTIGPVRFWTPALAPAGTQFIRHNSWGAWNGNLVIGSLTRRHLLMVAMNNGQPGNETVLLNNIGRVRHVRQAPNGTLYVSVEDGGRLLQLVPSYN